MDLVKSQNFQPEVSLKKITPPLDPILNYFIFVLAFTAATTFAVQFSKDGVSCFAVRCPSNGTCEILHKPPLTAFLNSECQKSLESYESYIAFIFLAESFAIICVYNLCTVVDPRCSNTLQQFVRITEECSDLVGTPQQISYVLTPIEEGEKSTVRGDKRTRPSSSHGGTDSPEEISPSEISATLDEASKSAIKTVYYKIKTFGDIQISATHFRNYYSARIFFLFFLPLAFFIANLHFSIRSSFKCSLSNKEELVIANAAYDHIVCSRSLSSFLVDTSRLYNFWLIMICAITAAFIIPLLRKYYQFSLKGRLNDLAVLLLLLSMYSPYEFERFILFYSKGKGRTVPHSSTINYDQI